MQPKSGLIFHLSPFQGGMEGTVHLPVSKSESNRALMLQAYSNQRIKAGPVSAARDSQVLIQALSSNEPTIDVGDAGTAFRFLTVYFALKGGSKQLTGSSRMKERPIGPLVEALRQLGCDVQYVEKEGYPPLKFGVPCFSEPKTIEIDVQTSSQFASALVLAGPGFPNGIDLILTGEQNSRSYLFMTLKMLEATGLKMHISSKRIQIPAQEYPEFILTPEADWSSAGYWLAIAALVPGEVDLHLPGLHSNSLQGDSKVIEILKNWGVECSFSKKGLDISRKTQKKPQRPLELNLSEMPDFVQTLLVLCALTGVEANLTGLQTLAYKETDRLFAMSKELKKMGIQLDFNNAMGTCKLIGNQSWQPCTAPVKVYNDHRMAMAFAVAACQFPIRIENPFVVEKSYPGFWADLERLGFRITAS